MLYRFLADKRIQRERLERVLAAKFIYLSVDAIGKSRTLFRGCRR
jgi:hypothetical protein